jgi:hypothetical protein
MVIDTMPAVETRQFSLGNHSLKISLLGIFQYPGQVTALTNTRYLPHSSAESARKARYAH